MVFVFFSILKCKTTRRDSRGSGGFIVAGEVIGNYIDKVPGLEPTLKNIDGEEVINLGNKILKQNMNLKLMGLERYIDSQNKEEE